MSDPMCQATSKSTGQGCLQPERWLVLPASGEPTIKVCQQHGRMLERQGGVLLRELHPVPGFAREKAATG